MYWKELKNIQLVKKQIKLSTYFLKNSYLFIRFLIEITTNTPAKFPNKSDHWKLLSGIIKCKISSNIESEIKYIIRNFIWSFLMKVKKPIKVNKINT